MAIRSNAASGRNARKEARLKAKKKFEDAFHDNLRTYFPGLFDTPRSCTDHTENLENFVNFIKGHKLDLTTKKDAIRQLNHFIDNINIKENWQLTKAPQINSAVRRPTRRTHQHQTKVNIFRKWFCNFESKLSEFDLNKNEKFLQCYVLLSALTYGGLATPTLFKQLIQELNSNATPFETAKDWIWIDLVFKDSHASPNYRKDDEEFCLRRWIPDTNTLALINLYFSHENRSPLPEREDEILKLFSDICDDLEIDRLPIQGPKKFRQLCKVAYGAIELKPGISLPEHLIEVTTGRLLTSSLLSGDFQRLLGLRKLQNASLSSHPTLFGTASKRKPNFDKSIKDAAYQELRKLYNILRKARQRKPAIAALQNYTPVTPLVCLLQDWCISLLRERKIALSSTYSYLSQIGSFLIYETPSCDLAELTSDDWQAVYESIIERKTNVTERDNTAFRLMNFHKYQVSQNQFVPLEYPLIIGKPGQLSFVKAGFIDEQLFESVREGIRHSSALTQDEKTRLDVLAILAYRTGIRIGELLKLTSTDIEGTDELNILVRDNYFGKNKSQNARRILPLWLLLPEKEYHYVQQFLCNIPPRHKHLIFHHDGQPQSKWNTGEISYLISRLLKSISGEAHLSFHHFRHSALSRIQLVIEQDFELIETFTNYTKTEAQRLFGLAFGGSNNRNTAFLHLAKMAGHGEADTTFKHYLHLTDIVWFRTIQKRTDHITPQQATNLFGLSKNKATRLVKNPNLWKELHSHSAAELKKKGYAKSFRVTKASRLALPNEYFSLEFTKENLHAILHRHIILGKELENHWPKNRRTEIEDVFNVCRQLAEVETKYGKPRFPLVQQKGTNQKFVFPFSDLRNCSQDDLDLLLGHLNNLYTKAPNKVIALAKIVIFGSDKSEAGVSFSNPTQLKQAIKILRPVIPIERLRIKHQYPARASKKVRERIEQYWKASFPGDIKRQDVQVMTPHSKYMSARLTLLEKSVKKGKTNLRLHEPFRMRF